jgi:hypothetical protein
MSSPSIMVQQNDANNDPIEGPNGPVFLTDIDAVAQIIGTQLRLLRGEWWEDLTIGFPLNTAVLNSSAAPQNQEAVMLLIQQTIKAAPFVLDVLSFTFQNNTATRGSAFTAQVFTTFGNLTVTNAPGTAATITES